MYKYIISFILIFTFTFESCYLHKVSIVDKNYKEIDNENTINNFPIPLKVLFGYTQYEPDKIKYVITPLFDLGEFNEKDFNSLYKKSFFSEEYLAKFKNSKYFKLNSLSNLKIVINSRVEPKVEPISRSGKKIQMIENSYFLPGLNVGEFLKNMYIVAFLGLIATLVYHTFIPGSVYLYSDVQFDVIDSGLNKKIKSYNYKTEHKIYHSFLTVPIAGVIFPMFGEKYDQSNDIKTYAIARVVYNQFEKDFINDLNSDENLRNAAVLLDSPDYIFKKPEKDLLDKFSNISLMLAKLESQLIQKGFNIISSKLNKKKDIRIIKPNLVSINGMNYVEVECLNSKDNSMIWSFILEEEKELLEEVEEINSETYIDTKIEKFLEKLRSKGEID